MGNLIEEYQKIVGHEVIDQLYQVAKPLQGKSFVHVNSTKLGGGVAEILHKLIPLFQALGIDATWEVITGNPEFYQTTKSIHNGLQGNPVIFTEQDETRLRNVNEENAPKLRSILESADYVVIHDPQPLPMIEFCPKRKGKWIWRCHVDATKPSRSVWNHLKGYIGKYDASIFSLADFAHPLPKPTYLIAPSIDPLSEKNINLSQTEVTQVLESFQIDPERPMILQVSRYDRFKDPLGVIEAYRIAKKFSPDLQCVLAGGGATDDPEGEIVLQMVNEAAKGDEDIKVLLLPPDAHRTINALQRGANIVLQKSIKEGFGLTVSEALWKGRPVIGGNVGGIRLQVTDYDTGFLVNTPEGAAQKIRFLLQNREKAIKMGHTAKEFVKENFLITRHILEYMTMLITLANPDKTRFEVNK